MKRNLYVALLLLLVVAAVGLILQLGPRRVSAAYVQPDQGSLAFLPARSTALFGADVEGLRNTSLYKNLVELHGQKRDADYDAFVAQTGFDPLRDVRTVTGAQWKDGEEIRAAVVVIATFDRAKVTAFIKGKPEVAVESHGGYELFTPQPHEGETAKDHGAFAFLDNETIIAGTAAAVRQAIDQKMDVGGSVLGNQALMSRLTAIGGQNQVWGVTNAPGTLIKGELPPEMGQGVAGVLNTLKASSFGLNATSDLRMFAQADCATDKDAQTLADTGRGLIAMARLMSSANQRTLQLLNTVQVDQYGNQVKVTVQMPPELLSQLIAGPEAFIPHTEQHQPSMQNHMNRMHRQ